MLKVWEFLRDGIQETVEVGEIILICAKCLKRSNFRESAHRGEIIFVYD